MAITVCTCLAKRHLVTVQNFCFSFFYFCGDLAKELHNPYINAKPGQYQRWWHLQCECSMSEWVKLYVQLNSLISGGGSHNQLYWYWQLKINKKNTPETQKRSQETNWTWVRKKACNTLNTLNYTKNSRCLYTYKNDCVQLWQTIKHWTVLTIFPRILQTIITAQMMFTEGTGRGAGISSTNQPQQFNLAIPP